MILEDVNGIRSCNYNKYFAAITNKCNMPNVCIFVFMLCSMQLISALLLMNCYADRIFFQVKSFFKANLFIETLAKSH